MSRKRDLPSGPSWGQDRALRSAAAEMLDAGDDVIAAKAEELGADVQRLKAFVFDAKRRKQPTNLTSNKND